MSAVGYAPVPATTGAGTTSAISGARRNFSAMTMPAPKMVYLCPNPSCGEVATGAG